MLPHDELYHYGVRGMRWGIRKAPGVRASEYQRKADISRAKGSTSKANKYLAKAKKYQKISAKLQAKKSLEKKLDPKDQKKHLTTFQKAAISIGTGVTIGAIGRLIGPSIDQYGKKMAAKRANDIFRYASKNFPAPQNW